MSWSRSGNIAGNRTQVFTVTMTADGAGAFTDSESPDFPMGGYVVGTKVQKGGTAPDSSIDVTLKDEQAIDTLTGTGAAIDITSAAAFLRPEDGNGNATVYPFKGKLTLGIANNGAASAVVIAEVHLSFPK